MAEVAAKNEGERPGSSQEVTAKADAAPRPPETAPGTMTLREDVVAKIAGMAAREVEGVHSMGTGAFMEKLARGGDVKRGVRVKAGQKEAAFDLWLTVDYGCHIPTVVDLVRKRITERVFSTTGLISKEINIEVVDVVLPEQGPAAKVE